MLPLPKITAAAGLIGPAHDWPSGLALGPSGWIMTATFIGSGLLMAGFGWGLRQVFESNRGVKIASTLVALSGLALAGLASPADLTDRITPATWHGVLHDLSYVALGLTLFPAMLRLAWTLRRRPGWRRLSQFTGLVLALSIPSFVLKGIAVYLFLAAVLAWCEAFALRLYFINSE